MLLLIKETKNPFSRAKIAVGKKTRIFKHCLFKTFALTLDHTGK